MFFPIGDDQVQRGNYPYISYGLIVVNVLVFLFQATLPQGQAAAFVFRYGAIPVEVMHGIDLDTLLSSMFLHGGWMHLIGNMLFLWVFADNIEATVGSGRFLLFYLLGGIVAALVHAFMNPYSDLPCVGASGAISAVLGAYLVMFPTSKIRILFLLFFITFRIPAFLFLGIWIYQQYANGMAALGPATADTSGVAWWAHIGGFAVGVLAGFNFRSRVAVVQQRLPYEDQDLV